MSTREDESGTRNLKCTTTFRINEANVHSTILISLHLSSQIIKKKLLTSTSLVITVVV